jgi:hypothetical protein
VEIIGCLLQSHFSTSLSQKIRHIRYGLKRKSESSASLGQTAAKKTFITTTADSGEAADKQSDLDVQSHLDELKKEWAKKNSATRSSSHLKMLLKNTRQYRLNLLKKFSQGGVKPILAEFPCFEEAAYVSAAFTHEPSNSNQLHSKFEFCNFIFIAMKEKFV